MTAKTGVITKLLQTLRDAVQPYWKQVIFLAAMGALISYHSMPQYWRPLRLSMTGLPEPFSSMSVDAEQYDKHPITLPQTLDLLKKGRVSAVLINNYQVRLKTTQGPATLNLAVLGGLAAPAYQQLITELSHHPDLQFRGETEDGADAGDKVRGLIGLLINLAMLLFIANTALQSLGWPGLTEIWDRLSDRLFGRKNSEPEAKITLDDVVGVRDAKEALSGIVDYLRSPDLYAQMGAKPPCGVLLEGPPGTGKTMLAQALAAEANAHFIPVTGGDFSAMFYGVGQMRVKSLFRKARRNAPCVIFVDEMDGLGKRSTFQSSGVQEENRIINTFLTEMQGFHPSDGVIVVGATNNAANIDEALTRPGRMDVKIRVNPPTFSDRMTLLNKLAERGPFDKAIPWKAIAARTTGMSPADIRWVMNSSKLLALKAGRTEVDYSHVVEAVRRQMVGGGLNSGIELRPEEQTRVAYHEVGHALAMYVHEKKMPEEISIIPQGRALGLTIAYREEDAHIHTLSELKAALVTLFAGRVAEELFCGEGSTGAEDDLLRASKLATRMVTTWGLTIGGTILTVTEEDPSKEHDEEISRWLKWARSEALATLCKHKPVVHAMAVRVQEQGTLLQDEIALHLEEVDENQDGDQRQRREVLT